MSTTENKAIVQHFLDGVIGKRNVAAADTMCIPNLVWHGASVGELPNLEAFKYLLSAFFTAFPDLTVTSVDLIGEADKVVARYTWSGKHQGEFQGIPPTGKQVTVTGITIYRLVDGKIVEQWWQEDVLGLMQQLGAVPSMR